MAADQTVAERAIGDYGIIGNGQSAALVATNGSIDWCCWPQFDSPAVFCRILDARRGGYFRIEPTTPYRTSRSYVGLTNVLATTFHTADAEARITDLMPAPWDDTPEDDTDNRRFPHRILRKIEGISGRVELEIELHPTFEYARDCADWQIHADGLIARHGREALSLACPVRLQPRADAMFARHTLSAGQSLWLVLTHGPTEDADEPLQFSADDADAELDQTLQYWNRWLDTCRYQGRYRDQVHRSILLLKLLIFAPTGAPVAAPTTSLPEAIGGVRNWDYRYTWLRDSGLLFDVLQQLGYHDESMRFIDWLEAVHARCDGDLQIMYTVQGHPLSAEQRLDHLAGYRGSKPVRLGNCAAGQTQLDVDGHVIDAVVLCLERMPRPLSPELWDVLRSLADRAASRWRDPDHGPWEIGGEPQHFLYSKLYCWVALDRALRLAQRVGQKADLQHWRREQAAIRDAILTRGFCQQQAAFTQAFGSPTLDASVLMMPLVQFLPATDHRMRSTIQRIQSQLGRDGLLYRYLDDPLPGREGTFTMCSFWMVSNLALSGQLRQARQAFEQICGHANDLGLLGEQIDPDSGEALGNFPQAFTHLGLVRAALHIDQAERAQQ